MLTDFQNCISIPLIEEEKTIATFAAICWNIISGTKNYIEIAQVDWPEAIVIWVPLERRKVEVHIFDRASIFLVRESSPPKGT